MKKEKIIINNWALVSFVVSHFQCNSLATVKRSPRFLLPCWERRFCLATKALDDRDGVNASVEGKTSSDKQSVNLMVMTILKME
jgi:hypothetical protein